MNDDGKGLYAILNQGKNLLGQTGERLAFFPIPPNAQDAWHGYPTNSQYIGDELVEHWYSINVISKGIYRKLFKTYLMNPVVKFSINVEAIDCYLYGGYLFLVMADGQLLYVSYHKVVNRLKYEYPQYSSLIELIFLHNEYSKGEAAKIIFGVTEIREVVEKNLVESCQRNRI